MAAVLGMGMGQTARVLASGTSSTSANLCASVSLVDHRVVNNSNNNNNNYGIDFLKMSESTLKCLDTTW